MASSTVIATGESAVSSPETPQSTRQVGDRHADEEAAMARARHDPAAFAPLYQAYVGPIYRYCYRRLGSREAAEDTTSMVFERALRSLSSFHGGSFRSWLFTIAHNVVTDTYRRKGAQASLDAAEDLVDPTPRPEQMALVADEQRLLSTALALLPPDQRQVIELRLSGLRSVEVAEILGRSPEAIRALQLRATRRLQTLLADHGAASEVRHA